MEHTWRWYGPNDTVSLQDIRQTGATGVVTALHHIPNGDIWTTVEIIKRKEQIESQSLSWSVVESIPVHEDIKRKCGRYDIYINNYKKSIQNLAQCGIDTICYNFMPVLDWTRTDLAFELSDGSRALRFDQIAFAVFDIHLLRRQGAEADYSASEIHDARKLYQRMSKNEIDVLIANIIAGLPGAEEGYSLEEFQKELDAYANIDKAVLREHFAYFLKEIIPVCEACNVRLAVHPDDPPRPILGLPRIVSTIEDLEWLVSVSSSAANGLTMCTGSYGVRADNDLVSMIQRFGNRVYFTHLRSTQREDNPNSFYEASHLSGDVDMVEVVGALLREERRRESAGEPREIAMRPDHGHQILDDLTKQSNPGYSAIGRLKGLAEIRGLETALKRLLFD